MLLRASTPPTRRPCSFKSTYRGVCGIGVNLPVIDEKMPLSVTKSTIMSAV